MASPTAIFKENEYKYKEVAHIYSFTFTNEDIDDLKIAHEKYPCEIIKNILIEIYNHTGEQKHLPEN